MQQNDGLNLRELFKEMRDDMRSVRTDLAGVRADLSDMKVKGCAKGGMHDDHERRLHAVEIENAEGRGKAMVRQGLMATAVSLVIALVVRMFGK
jgi:hypothetical protein